MRNYSDVNCITHKPLVQVTLFGEIIPEEKNFLLGSVAGIFNFGTHTTYLLNAPSIGGWEGMLNPYDFFASSEAVGGGLKPPRRALACPLIVTVIKLYLGKRFW
jgi:hypothetical protein